MNPLPRKTNMAKILGVNYRSSGGLFECRRMGALGRNSCQRDVAPSGPDIYMDAPDTGRAIGGRRGIRKNPMCMC